jgi:hypothetical protein
VTETQREFWPLPLKAFGLALLGLALGLLITRGAISERLPIAVDTIGPWRVEARAGEADADPYTRARIERSGEIPLGLGEGLRMTTRADSDGGRLDPRCAYKVGPKMPPARFWTLEVTDLAGFPTANSADRYGLRSTEILREADGSFTVWVSPRAHPGNWLPVGEAARFALTLRLYDPALGGAAVGFENAIAPSVVKERCG